MGYANDGQIKTPTFNRMHSRGIALSQYYVQPSCSPTRATLLTGRAPRPQVVPAPRGSRFMAQQPRRRSRSRSRSSSCNNSRSRSSSGCKCTATTVTAAAPPPPPHHRHQRGEDGSFIFRPRILTSPPVGSQAEAGPHWHQLLDPERGVRPAAERDNPPAAAQRPGLQESRRRKVASGASPRPPLRSSLCFCSSLKLPAAAGLPQNGLLADLPRIRQFLRLLRTQ